jgi:hypothetical protein
MGNCRISTLRIIHAEKFLLNFFEIADCNSGFILNNYKITVESTITKKTKPSLTKV